MIIIILFVVVLIGGTAFIYINLYNELQHFNTRIELAETSINENLNKKFELISEANKEIKKISKDKNYLKDYIELNQNKITPYEYDRKLIECVNLINELKHDNKKLNNDDFEKILKNLKQIDAKLTASKNFYNKNAAILNDLIKKFPNNFIAQNHKIKIKPFFGKKNKMQDDTIDDFKL